MIKKLLIIILMLRVTLYNPATGMVLSMNEVDITEELEELYVGGEDFCSYSCCDEESCETEQPQLTPKK